MNLMQRIPGIVTTITDSQLKIPPASFFQCDGPSQNGFEFFLRIWYISSMEDVLEKQIGTPDCLIGKKEIKMKLKMRIKGIPSRFFYSPTLGGIRTQAGERIIW